MNHAPNDDWFPLEPDEHERQLRALRRRLAGRPRRILDLGAGDGRLARPLADEGHTVFALDRDPAALERCAAPNITTIHADALDPRSLGAVSAPIDAALILGHTFLTFEDPMMALSLLLRLRRLLAPAGGALYLDAFPVPLWREIAEGNWQEGISEDAGAQLLWRDGDNVIALRAGDDVDDASWTLGPRDTPLRIWSFGELRLLAHAAGYDPPEAVPDDHLLILRPHDRSPQPPDA